MNINKSSGKVSHLEKLINKLMILIFLIQLLLSIIAAAISSIFYHYQFGGNLQNYIIFDSNYNTITAGVFSFFSYFISSAIHKYIKIYINTIVVFHF